MLAAVLSSAFGGSSIAAKRALALGYTDVAWYPEGSDGWAAAGLPVEKRTPEPRP
jgi:rhodanese-related sulfurtransferase